MPNKNALAIANQYPTERFNLLIPVKTMQEISPMHKVVVNEVQLDPNPDKKDVYKEKNGELAPTKKGLAKLMAAANIQILDSRPIPTQKCNKCYSMAAATKLAPKCFECPFQDDVAYQVTIAVPEPSGTFRVIKATKELRMADEKAKMTDAQYKAFFPYRTEQAETKALNRALREGLMTQSTYKEQDLKKPFAVALVVPNFTDPDMKAAMIQRFASGAEELFGPPKITGGKVQALPEGKETHTVEVVCEDDDDMPPSLDEEAPSLDVPFYEGSPPEEEPPIECQGCACIVEPFTDNKNKFWTPQEMAEWTKENLGRIFCQSCAAKEMRAIAAKQKQQQKKGA